MIKSENIFSKFYRDVCNIEYQKCGLLHIHLLIFFNLANEFLEASYIDKIICIELSIVEKNLTYEFTKIITSVIFHSLCREINPNSLYISHIQDDLPKYLKYYPCNVFEETFIQENGYPIYHQHNNGFIYKILYLQD